MEAIKFRELVELFLTESIQDIKSERETPNINFKFDEDGFTLFYDIFENPFVKEGHWTPNASQKDIDFVRYNNDDDVPTIYISDSIIFFEYLENIINSMIELNAEYKIKSSARSMALNILRRIWLRLGIEDISNIESFLDKQLQFTKNRLLDTYKEELVGSLHGYEVFMRTYVNPTWAETTRCMVFTIKGNDSTYELPNVLYDIDDNGICYIYAVQSSKEEKNKKIERELYKINKNIESPNVHPSKVYSMLFFINELKKKGITKVRIPSMQILSYRYHELLGAKAKKDLEKAQIQFERYPDETVVQRKYKSAKEWYEATYEKQDKISYLKTVELINLAYRMLAHDTSIEIINEINVQGDYLGMKIK